MTDPSPGTVPATSGSVVAFEHVTKRYGDGPPAVTDLSLEIGAGEVCVLVGPSGCGKTTTMKMVNRLVEPTNGRVTIDGEDVASLPPVELRRRIGYVIQQVGLFPHLTVGDNVAVVPRLLGWSPPSITERVEELLELVGLDPGTYRARYPAALSGGERQRVGVARAMAADPTVLLMDEPFGAVDPIRRERLQNDLLRLQARLRKTIVFVTHDVDEAIKMADRIAILQVGGVLAQYDSPDRLLAAPANAFVERFVGADRGLKRLSLARVGDLELEVPSTVTIGEPIQAARARMPGGVGWILVTDSRMRAVGWVNVSDLAGDGSVTEDMAIPGSALLQPESTLRDALSAMLASSVQTGVVVDANDELLGVVHVNAISATLQDGGVGGVTQDFFRLDWVIDNLGMLAERTAEHVVLTVIAMVGGILIAFPVTLFIHRRRRLIGPVLGFSGILYAVPSLALFAFLIPVTGIGLLTAEIALVSYTLLILIRNGLAGLDGVEPEIVEAATGLGHTPRQRLWRVELPLATPVIMAGIRIATVTTIGLVAVTALIGQGGLGFVIITLGIRRQFETAIVVGVILSVLLAVLADRGLVLLERMLTPWARARAEGA